MSKLSQVLDTLSTADVEIDEAGRIVIKDPEAARTLMEIPATEQVRVPPTNTNCNHGC